MFTGINTIGNAETKIKIKCLQPSILEIMSLNHTKIINWLGAHMEFNAETNNKKYECV